MTNQAKKKKLLRRAVKELHTMVTQGCQVVPLKDGGEERIPYAELDEKTKQLFLTYGIDWTYFVNRGMEVKEIDKIVDNFLAGKPPEKWLEGIDDEDKRKPSHVDRKAVCSLKPSGKLGRTLTPPEEN